MKKIRNIFLIFIWTQLALFLACSSNDAGTRVGNPPTNTTTIFPSNLTIVSPLDTTTATSSVNSNNLTAYISARETETTSAIQSQIDGTNSSDCFFEDFDVQIETEHAACYGPVVRFTNHPADSSSGSLIRGDLGLWTKTDSETSNACAVAELNA